MSEVIPTTSETENPDKLLRVRIHDLAERYWKTAPYKKNGIARFAEPLDLASELGSELEDLFCEDFPWGLKPTRLVSLGWSGWGPGTGFDWRLFSLPLKSGRRIYVVDTDNDGPVIIAVSQTSCTQRIEKGFLTELFGHNGESFGIGVIGSAPNRIGSAIASRGFFAKLLIAAFDRAECWDDDDELDQYALSGDKQPYDAAAKTRIVKRYLRKVWPTRSHRKARK